jgi:hypothetical protein
MRLIIYAAIVLAAVSGCTTTKQWTATGGSRSDGVVRLSYELGEFESPRLNEDQGVQTASQRCRTWGYSGAEAFGGTLRQCTQSGGLGGCSVWTVTKEYQCTGNGASNDSRTTFISPSPQINHLETTPAPAGEVDGTARVLNAQAVSKSQGCGDVHADAAGFRASCGSYDLVIDCDGTRCRPLRTEAR